jgi:hypothetical protein
MTDLTTGSAAEPLHLHARDLDPPAGDGGPEVGMLVSWESYTHLEIRAEKRGLMLVLHVPTMWTDLQRVMAQALTKVHKGDGQTVSTDWKNGRVWEASDAALSEWATVLGLEKTAQREDARLCWMESSLRDAGLDNIV